MKAAGGRKSPIARPVVLVLDAPPADGAPELEAMAAAGIEAELITWGGGAARDGAALERADFILTWRTPLDEAMVRRAARALVIVHYGPGAGRGAAPVAVEAARATGIYVASVPDYATESWGGRDPAPDTPDDARDAGFAAARPGRDAARRDWIWTGGAASGPGGAGAQDGSLGLRSVRAGGTVFDRRDQTLRSGDAVRHGRYRDAPRAAGAGNARDS